MSRFLRFSAVPVVFFSLLVWLSSCCYGTKDEEYTPPLEFVIVDQTGENVLLTAILPVNVVWFYPEGNKAMALHPYADFDRGVFVINVTPEEDYEIAILSQSFAHLDLNYVRQNSQCYNYKDISGVSINGIKWDYQANPILTLVYNP